MHPNQRSRGHVLRCTRPHSAASVSRRIHAVLLMLCTRPSSPSLRLAYSNTRALTPSGGSQKATQGDVPGRRTRNHGGCEQRRFTPPAVNNHGVFTPQASCPSPARCRPSAPPPARASKDALVERHDFFFRRRHPRPSMKRNTRGPTRSAFFLGAVARSSGPLSLWLGFLPYYTSL